MSQNTGEQILLFSDKREWADVVPLEQYEGDAVAPIFYSETYKDATDYFRGIVKAGEKSQRVLELTESIIRQNPAHYTAWQYRYETLLAINAPLDTELLLMDELAIKYLKTYQVWHHRKLLVTLSGKPKPELDFITVALSGDDQKNYHTWSYRQWLLSYFNNEEDLWSGELDFVEKMLTKDVRNNSAWHHRFFVVWASGVRSGEQDRERVLRRESIYVKQNISLAPNNPAAWNYLRGMLDHVKVPYLAVSDFVKLYTVPFDPSRPDLVDLENPPPSQEAQLPCVQAVEFLADVHEREGGKEDIEKAVEVRHRNKTYQSVVLTLVANFSC
ncbi:farnesyltransferase [Amanita muscaria]